MPRGVAKSGVRMTKKRLEAAMQVGQVLEQPRVVIQSETDEQIAARLEDSFGAMHTMALATVQGLSEDAGNAFVSAGTLGTGAVVDSAATTARQQLDAAVSALTACWAWSAYGTAATRRSGSSRVKVAPLLLNQTRK